MNRHTPHRDGEAAWSHERSSRTFIVAGQWFFRTREFIDVGPYPSQEAADSAAAQLSEMLDGINDVEITAQFIREFMLLRDR